MRFETALAGDDLSEIKEAHAALKATEQTAKACKLHLGGKLSQRVRAVVLENVLGTAKRTVSPTVAEANITAVVDQLIERLSQLKG